MYPNTSRRFFKALFSVAMSVLGVSVIAPAHAQFASNGVGQYRNQILWFNWGVVGGNVRQGGVTVTNEFDVAGQPFEVSCTLSAISGTSVDPDLTIWQPGDYIEDGLDNLYNDGFSGSRNGMNIGIGNRQFGTDATFTYSCSATLAGNPYVIDGLVFADAETTSTQSGEFIRTVLPAGTTMRVIERYRGGGCATGYNVNLTGSTYQFQSLPPYSCYGGGKPEPDQANAMGVNFIDNATTATITLHGGGLEAVALGVMLNVADYGDAPSSYGSAAHLPQYTWSGGTLPAGNTNIFGAGFTPATLVQPVTALLGARVDVEDPAWAGAGAALDDADGNGDDEDGVNAGALAPLYAVSAGTNYTVPVVCTGTAAVAGWIDFDRNGTFDADERSATTACAGGNATLSWIVNADIAVGQSYLRVRTATNAAEIANPTGVAGTGEAEDYALAILVPSIRIAKITRGDVGGPFAFATTNTLAQPASLTTVAAGVAVTGAPVTIADTGMDVVVTEALPAGWKVAAINCIDANGGAFAPIYDVPNGRATIPASSMSSGNSDITCTFTNDQLIDAVDDTSPPVNGFAGGTTPSVLVNDTLNGAPVVPADVTLTPGTSPNPGLVMNPDGTITIATGTPAGTYAYPYTICEALNPTNCDTATATVTVTAPVIDAVDDTSPPVNGFAGGTTPSVLVNDTLNGAAVVPADVTVTPGASPNPGLVMNPDGTITVASGTPAGTYAYPYTICEVANPTNCDSATATITVTAPVIDAVDDAPGAVNGTIGATTQSVLVNDTLNGVAVVPADVTLTPGASPHPGLLMNPDGTITIAPGTPAGTYLYRYTICEVVNPSNCDTAAATVTVTAGNIDAVDDAPSPVNGFVGGGTTPSVLVNDTLNGVPVVPANVTLTPGVSPNPGLVMNPDGTITVAAGTPAGTYPYPYTICEVLNPTNCDTATATITVTAPVIDAVDDTSPPVNGFNGGTTPSVLLNDTLNGASVVPTDVTVTAGTSPHTGLVMNTDGTITIAAGTPAGTYLYPYTLCEVVNPANCDTATATVTVTAPVIDAVDDTSPPVNGFNGGTTPSVLINDTLNGAPVVPADVTLTPGVSPNPGLVMNPDGTITIAAGTPAGTYAYPYTICEVLNPSNCDTATAMVTVTAPVVDAVDDTSSPVNGFNGGTTPSALINDTLNGAPVMPADVTLTPGTSPNPGLAMNTDGTITIAPGTPAGTYAYPYTICEVLNPTNCDTATATMTVIASVIDAVDDTSPPVNGFNGGTTLSVLINDTLNGAPVMPANVTATPGSSPNPGLTMNPDGTITIAPGTPTGIYLYPYTLCEVLNPTNCDTAVATVTVAGKVLLRIVKTVAVREVRIGDLVRYTLTVENVGDASLVNGSIMDTPPAGFGYVEGSLRVVDGDNHASVEGNSPLRFNGLDVAVGQRATLTYLMRVEAGVRPGMHQNQAQAFSTDGRPVSNVASAEVQLTADPLLDDSLIFGTVFDDQDGDGWQDENERGIPGVRIASVEGLLIETDQYGRYHLAGMPGGPAERGRNFILKVDPSTLPAGAEFTTDNPLLRRITPGVPVRFDWGVKLPVQVLEGTRQVEMELGEVFFAPGSAEVRAKYQPVIDKIAAQVREHHGGEVVIDVNGDNEDLVFDRAMAVKYALLTVLDAESAKRLVISARSHVDDPDSLVVGVDEGGALLGTVLFDTDKASIRPEFEPLLDKVAAALDRMNGGAVAIVGHTDTRASYEYNTALGMRRAKAVYEALAKRLSPEVRAKVRVQASNDPRAPVGTEQKQKGL